MKLPSGVNEGTRTQLEDGDVLVSITADIGIVGYVDDRVPKPAYINQHIALVRFDSAKTNAQFVSYFLAAENSQKLFRGLTDVGAKTGMNLATICKIRLALPPSPEQRAIAGALGDVDALVGALEKLIAKKRDLKQAAMQQLLTGQKRLPGFSGEWEVRTMSEIAGSDQNIVDGPFGSNLKTSDYVDAGVPVLQGLNITGDRFTWKGVRFILARKAQELYRSNAQVGDLLCIKIGSVGFSALITTLEGYDYAIIPANLLRVRISDMFSPHFVHYALSSTQGKQMLRDLAGNTAQPAISLNGFRRLKLLTPPSLPEQTAIAEVLSDMDAEIAALEQRLAKTRALKQGMMQELLTGKTRLVDSLRSHEQERI